MKSTLSLTTPYGLNQLEIEDGNEQQTIHEMVLKQVLAPSEKYICHLCVNRFSIIDPNLSFEFITLLAQLVRISPFYQPTMELVLHLPVLLTIPGCFTFFDDETGFSYSLSCLNVACDEWDKQGEIIGRSVTTLE
ncbi:hypothetical protein BLNAU_19125 [Blattamonas nauphoetae]|uniref:Uncharacterized protein n=1 Tax=Blattamonas nauphoetae TaxID=2049346 RepID=A0ABQ9X2J0_9EUKA|nr:hypothetical protein BLNAU_19125 [Blattamonas nauphoetae]